MITDMAGQAPFGAFQGPDKSKVDHHEINAASWCRWTFRIPRCASKSSSSSVEMYRADASRPTAGALHHDYIFLDDVMKRWPDE